MTSDLPKKSPSVEISYDAMDSPSGKEECMLLPFALRLKVMKSLTKTVSNSTYTQYN